MNASQTSSWQAVCAALDKHVPEWSSAYAGSAEDAAVEAIRRLAEGGIPIKGRLPGVASHAIVAAAEKLVRGKGRYHSEQNYRALAALFGVVTPDLEPLVGDTITVTEEALLFAVGEAYAAGYNHGHLNTVDHLPYAEGVALRERGQEVFYDYLDPSSSRKEKAE